MSFQRQSPRPGPVRKGPPPPLKKLRFLFRNCRFFWESGAYLAVILNWCALCRKRFTGNSFLCLVLSESPRFASVWYLKSSGRTLHLPDAMVFDPNWLGHGCRSVFRYPLPSRLLILIYFFMLNN